MFVREKPRPRRGQQRLPTSRPVDLSMNLSPEPDDPELIERMHGVEYVSCDILSLLRYRGFSGTQADKDAASTWLGRRALVPARERIFVSPGAHPALVGILSILAKPGDVVLCETLTYPSIRMIAAQPGHQTSRPRHGCGSR
jgi:DNA-binding transcriptional MocR family regulator